VEVRSVNHRGLRVTYNVPQALRTREQELGKLLGAKILRGHLYLSLSCELASPGTAQVFDHQSLQPYLQEVKQLEETSGVRIQVDLGGLLRLPGVVRDTVPDGETLEGLWPDILRCVEAALDELLTTRNEEGRALAGQLGEICDSIQKRTRWIEENCADLTDQYRCRLKARVGSLLEEAGLDLREEDIHREVVLYAERSDVGEELTRMRSHLAQFRHASEAATPVGRKLDFIAQEMLREANTMSAKTPSSDVVREIVELKTDIARLKEQVQNVE